jgi:hypothetical protein
MDKFGINRVENEICDILGDFRFKKMEKGYEIGKYSGNSKEVIINEKYNESLNKNYNRVFIWNEKMRNTLKS